MNDRMKESLSALCDGECDELEFRRVLNQLELEPELKEDWQRYHMIGSIMRGEKTANLDLLQGINDKIDGVEPDSSLEHQSSSYQPIESSKKTAFSGGLSQMLVSGAVAASVTLAVLVGVRMNVETSSFGTSSFVSTAPSTVSAQPANLPVAEAFPSSATQVADAEASPELEKAQQALQQFVLDRADSLDEVQLPANSFARVASFGQETEVVQSEKKDDNQESKEILQPQN